MTTVGIATGAGSGMGRACGERLAEMVDLLVLVDIDESSVKNATASLTARTIRAEIETAVVDITDVAALTALAERVAAVGELRAVAHAAGISPTMSDWRRMFTVDLVGSARLLGALRPLATQGTALVCFASMSAALGTADNPAVDAVLDDPLAPDFLDRIRTASGPDIEDPGLAYAWAKRGVQRLVRAEAVRLGAVGARICSISPGIIDTPMGRQEAKHHEYMQVLVDMTPLGREGRAEEVAAVAAFLLSDDAAFVSGIDVLVDGGVCAAVSMST